MSTIQSGTPTCSRESQRKILLDVNPRKLLIRSSGPPSTYFDLINKKEVPVLFKIKCTNPDALVVNCDRGIVQPRDFFRILVDIHSDFISKITEKMLILNYAKIDEHVIESGSMKLLIRFDSSMLSERLMDTASNPEMSASKGGFSLKEKDETIKWSNSSLDKIYMMNAASNKSKAPIPNFVALNDLENFKNITDTEEILRIDYNSDKKESKKDFLMKKQTHVSKISNPYLNVNSVLSEQVEIKEKIVHAKQKAKENDCPRACCRNANKQEQMNNRRKSRDGNIKQLTSDDSLSNESSEDTMLTKDLGSEDLLLKASCKKGVHRAKESPKSKNADANRRQGKSTSKKESPDCRDVLLQTCDDYPKNLDKSGKFQRKEESSKKQQCNLLKEVPEKPSRRDKGTHTCNKEKSTPSNQRDKNDDEDRDNKANVQTREKKENPCFKERRSDNVPKNQSSSPKQAAANADEEEIDNLSSSGTKTYPLEKKKSSFSKECKKAAIREKQSPTKLKKENKDANKKKCPFESKKVTKNICDNDTPSDACNGCSFEKKKSSKCETPKNQKSKTCPGKRSASKTNATEKKECPPKVESKDNSMPKCPPKEECKDNTMPKCPPKVKQESKKCQSIPITNSSPAPKPPCPEKKKNDPCKEDENKSVVREKCPYNSQLDSTKRIHKPCTMNTLFQSSSETTMISDSDNSISEICCRIEALECRTDFSRIVFWEILIIFVLIFLTLLYFLINNRRPKNECSHFEAFPFC